MSQLQQLLPTACTTTPPEVLKDAREALNKPLSIGSDEVRAFCAQLSRLLLQDPRTKPYPELAALGFWLREASIDAMLQEHLTKPAGTLLVPTGIVFQIPPGNVESLFIYTAILALLCGNATIVRLSDTTKPIQQLLVALLTECMATVDERVRNRLILVRYDHDDTMTAILSAGCQLRLVWGGDATVTHIRTIPHPPLAREIGFSDRFSSSAMNATAYLAATDKEREALHQRFYTDLYWFDQQACVSPRLLFWVGTADEAAAAEAAFSPALAQVAEDKGYKPDIASNMAKLTETYLALHDLDVSSYRIFNPALTTVTLRSLDKVSAFKRLNYGHGLLLIARLDKLASLADSAERRDQALSLWGFTAEDIHHFLFQCQGRGYDRLVPVGQALAFDPVWDGINMFEVMTRLVKVAL